MTEPKSGRCWNCISGAGRWWSYPIMNCMNTETDHLIVSTDFSCKRHKPHKVKEVRNE